MFLSDQSIIVARERHAGLLREVERERRLNGLRQPLGRQRSFINRGRSLWSQGVHLLRRVVGERRAVLAPGAE
ncbi:MAG TPA: hypothetical protein VFU81_09755 [Thermomicrobiales bacterium]|nr:hypothetical protein [Thermomicrobiales bacterium]